MKFDDTLLQRIRDNDPTLTELDLWNNNLGAAGAASLSEALKQNGTLTALDLSLNNLGDAGAGSLSEALKQNRTLTALNLWGNDIGDAGAASLSEALKQNRTLTALNLGGNAIGAAGAGSLSAALKQNRTLTALDLSWNNLGDAGADSLSEALKQNRTLTELDLWNNNLGDAGAASLSEALKQNGTLTALTLSSNAIGDAGAASLSEALKQNGTLTELNLYNNNLGAAGAASLSAALKQNGTLTELSLWNNNLGDAGAASLSEALAKNHTLTTLNLSSNAIGDAGAASLSEALAKNHTLTTLNLSSNAIGAAGAASLSEALKQNGTLTELNLGGNNLGAAGAASLSEALKQNGTLTELNLGGNNIGAAGATSLSEALAKNRTLVELQLDAEVSQITKYIERNRTLVNNLITAIRTGTAESIATINELLSQGTSINQILGGWSKAPGSSPMMIACKKGNIAVIQTLLPHWNHHDLRHKKAILEIIIEKNDPAIIQSFTTHAIRNDDQTIIQALAITEAQQLQEHARQGIEYYNQGNYLEALKHLQPAAEQGGHAEAQYTLGLMYEKGQGVPQDDTTALKFYQQAATQEHPSAKKQLDLIKQKLAEKAKEEESAAAAPAAYQQSPTMLSSFEEYVQRMQQMHQQTTDDLQQKLLRTTQLLQQQFDELKRSNIEDKAQVEQRIADIQRSITLQIQQIRQAVQEQIGECMAKAVDFTDFMNKTAAQLEKKVTQLQATSEEALREEVMTATFTLKKQLAKNRDYVAEAQANKETLQQHARQLEKQLNSSQLTKEQQQQLQAELSQLKLQVIEIDGYQQILWQEYQVKEKKREAIRQFQTHPNLLIFYRTVQIKLEEIFIGSKAAASAFVNVSQGKVATAGKVASISINFFGKLFESIPGAGAVAEIVAGGVQKGAETIDEQRQMNTVRHISALATMTELKKHSEDIAMQLTKWYEPQLRKLATPEQSQAQKQGFVAKAKKIVIKAEGYPPARLFAEFGVKWMLDALQDLQIEHTTFSKQLIEIITHHNPSGKFQSVVTAIVDNLKSVFGVQTVKTTTGDTWSLSHIYTQTGIQTQDGYVYSRPKQHTAKYGYCSAASKEEAAAAAVARGLKLESSPQEEKQDAGGVSKGTRREVHEQRADITGLAGQVEILRGQLAHESEMRQQAQDEVAAAKSEATAARQETEKLKKQIITTDEKAEQAERRLAQMEEQMATMVTIMQKLQQAAAAAAPQPPSSDDVASDYGRQAATPPRQKFNI